MGHVSALKWTCETKHRNAPKPIQEKRRRGAATERVGMPGALNDFYDNLLYPDMCVWDLGDAGTVEQKTSQ